MTKEEVFKTLQPQVILFPLPAVNYTRFVEVIKQCEGCEILNEYWDGPTLVILTLRLPTIYHLFATGAVFQIDKDIDKVKEEMNALAKQPHKTLN